MKNLIIKIIMVVTSISFFIGCEDNRMDGMVKDKVYLVQSGVQEVYVNYRDFADYTVTVYKSGIGEQTANVSIEVDEETLKVYNEEENTSFEKKYVLPLKLHVDGNVDVNETSSRMILIPILE